MRGLLPLCEGLSVLCNNFPFNSSAAYDPATTRALDWTACLNAYAFCNLVRCGAPTASSTTCITLPS